MRLLAYAGIFWISLQYCRRSLRARQVLLAVVYAGAVYALYGLVVYLSGSETILIFRKSAYFGDVTSTFVNRNSYATYAALGFVCCTGLLLVLFTQAIEGGFTGARRIGRIVELIIGRGWPLMLAWIVLLLAMVLSHSRAGFGSALLGLLVLLVVAGLTRAIDRRLAVAFTAVCLGGLVWTVGIGGDTLLARLMQTQLAVEERPLVYERTLAAIGDSGCVRDRLGHLRGSVPLLPNRGDQRLLQHGPQHLPRERPRAGHPRGGDAVRRVRRLPGAVRHGHSPAPARRRLSRASASPQPSWSPSTPPSTSACRSPPSPPPTC